MKINIHNHASAVLTYNDKEILSNCYDETYPREIYRGRINLLGGGQGKGDISPEYTLKREINEEFSTELEEDRHYDSNFSDVIGEGLGAPHPELFASSNDILSVKEDILLDISPYKDFLISIPQYKKIPGFNVIISYYVSSLKKETIDCVKRNLNQGKSLVSEGFLKISKLEDIFSGNILTAWGSGEIIEDFFRQKVPNPDGMKFKELSKPRETMKDYFEEFDYFIQ